MIELLKEAEKIAPTAYAPYSNFRVGAALETIEGKIFLGVNVENRSFGLTNCAERTAIYRAVTEGYTKFKGLAIFALDGEYPISPCGACRQVISEFTGPDFPVIFGNTLENYMESTIGVLHPYNDLHELRES